MRFVIEGEWSGYTSRQQRIVHREVTTDKKLAEWCESAHGIAFTDGTMLYLSCRPAKPRERVQQIPSYRSLIRDCFNAGVWSVKALQKIQDERKAKFAAAKQEPA